MVLFFTSTGTPYDFPDLEIILSSTSVADPPAMLYMGKDKVESV